MQMPYNNQTIFELLDEHKEKTLELVAILDIDMLNKPHYYKVVFQDIFSKKDLPPVHIPPELLRYRYRVGNIYHQGRFLKNTMPKIYQFEIDNLKCNDLSLVSSVLSEEDIGFINERNRKYFLNQHCYHIAYEEYELIIPCYAIANRYLFLSSSMKKAVFKASLDSLCKPRTFKRQGKEAFLDVKHAIAKRDILYVCRFLDNQDSFNQFTYILNQQKFIKRARPFVAIKAKFVTEEIFSIHCTSRVIMKDGKPIYFITNILNDTSTLDFDYVKYRKFSSKGMIPGDIKVKKPTIVKKVPRKTTSKVDVWVSPSSEYPSHCTADYVKQDLNREGITLEEETVHKYSNTDVKYKNTDNAVNKGFEPSSKDGDEGVRPNSHITIDKDDEEIQNIFYFNNFILLHGALVQELGVVDQYISEPTSLKVRRSDSGYTPSRYYLADNKTVRHFFYGAFYYDNKQVYFIELELDKRWTSLSTWFFVTDDLDLELSEEDFQSIISKYIKECKNHTDFIDYLKNTYGFCFLPKKHQDVYNEESIYTWAESVLEQVSGACKNDKTT